jgi:hypothetical protein
MVACLNLNFHKELKLLINLKTLLGRTISNSLLFLEKLKIRFQNAILNLLKPMQACCKGNTYKMFYIK